MKFLLLKILVNNIRWGFEVMCLMVVKYFFLNSINGCFLNYLNKVLIKFVLGGYVYISVNNFFVIIV